MLIRKAQPRDKEAIFCLWNASVGAGEVVYVPLNDESYRIQFENNPDYDGSFDFVCEQEGEITGFISGTIKKHLLPGETHENTPGYLTVLFTRADNRRQGVGSALLDALENAFRAVGKASIMCSGNNPVNLRWLVPDTPSHDHNNTPGADIECAGYSYLLKHDYIDIHREVAMYLDLSKYVQAPECENARIRLLNEGIAAGRYDPALKCEFDLMCDRVGSEYWRKVLKDELASENPRPIFAGVYDSHIVGFTGPADVERSGRGWFTGICVDPTFSRRGIATVIFNDLMSEFIHLGARFSTLFTGVDNHAQKLYLHTGFTVKRTFAIMKKQL